MIFRVFCNFLAFTAFQKKWGKCNFRQNPNLFQCISSLFWWVYLKNGSLFISGLRDISHHTLLSASLPVTLTFKFWTHKLAQKRRMRTDSLSDKAKMWNNRNERTKAYLYAVWHKNDCDRPLMTFLKCTRINIITQESDQTM